MSGSLLGLVALLCRSHCWCSFIDVKVHCCMGFIVGPGLLLVLINCWGGFIVVLNHLWGRFHCWAGVIGAS